jgi:hypothetical protein
MRRKDTIAHKKGLFMCRKDTLVRKKGLFMRRKDRYRSLKEIIYVQKRYSRS